LVIFAVYDHQHVQLNLSSLGDREAGDTEGRARSNVYTGILEEMVSAEHRNARDRTLGSSKIEDYKLSQNQNATRKDSDGENVPFEVCDYK